MHYAVTARLKTERAPELRRRLGDGSIAAQRPDGREIVASMGRARVDAVDGLVRWTETCFCPSPLRHERETVYDRYFADIATEPADAEAPDGEPLLDVLDRLAE